MHLHARLESKNSTVVRKLTQVGEGFGQLSPAVALPTCAFADADPGGGSNFNATAFSKFVPFHPPTNIIIPCVHRQKTSCHESSRSKANPTERVA
jgi:hypothetical protein